MGNYFNLQFSGCFRVPVVFVLGILLGLMLVNAVSAESVNYSDSGYDLENYSSENLTECCMVGDSQINMLSVNVSGNEPESGLLNSSGNYSDSAEEAEIEDIALTNNSNEVSPENSLDAIITVGESGCDYTKIQDAINYANAGDTIFVKPGSYEGSISINKRLSLIGVFENENLTETKPEIVKIGAGTVVNINADDVVFDGFTIRRYGHGNYNDYGIFASYRKNIGISNITFLDEHDSGIYYRELTNSRISGCNFSFEGTGIRSYSNSMNNIIENNLFFDSGTNIEFSSSDSNQIQNNLFSGRLEFTQSVENNISENEFIPSGTYSSLTLNWNSNSNTITGNRFDSGCLYISDSSTNEVSGNIFSGKNSYGIRMSNSDSNRIIDNTIRNKDYGIYFYDYNQANNYNQVSWNNFSDCQTGIYFRSDSESQGNEIKNNQFSLMNYGISQDSYNSEKIYSLNIVNNSFCINSYGVKLRDIESSRIEKNSFYDVQTGVYLSSSEKNIIILNEFGKLRSYNLDIRSGSSTIVYLNNFTTPTYYPDGPLCYKSSSAAVFWNSTSELEYSYNNANYSGFLGNYWENYAGNDSSGDGIGDESYIYSGNFNITDPSPLIGCPKDYRTSEGKQLFPPCADFSVNTTSGNSPLYVEFSDISSGDPNKWEWDFGDGKKSYDQNVTHRYDYGGYYAVSLTVSNSQGSDTKKVADLIHVYSSVPTPTPYPPYPVPTPTPVITNPPFNPALYPDSYPVPTELTHTKRSGMSDKTVENRNIVFVYEDNLNLESLNPGAPEGDRVTKLCRYFNNFGGGDIVKEIEITDSKSALFTPEMFEEEEISSLLLNDVSASESSSSSAYVSYPSGGGGGGGGYSGGFGPTVPSEIDSNMGMYYVHNSSGLVGDDLGSYRVLFINYPIIHLAIAENESHSVISSGTNLNRGEPIAFRIGNNLAEAFESGSGDLPYVSLKFVNPENITSSEFGNQSYSEVPLMKPYTYTDQVSGIGKAVLDNVTSGYYSAEAIWPDDSIFSGLTSNSNEVSLSVPDSTVAWKISNRYLRKSSSYNNFCFEGKPLTKYYTYIKRTDGLNGDDYPEINGNYYTNYDINVTYAAWSEMVNNPEISDEIGNVAGTGAIITTDNNGNAYLYYKVSEKAKEQWFTFVVAKRDAPAVERDEVDIAVLSGSPELWYNYLNYNFSLNILTMRGDTSLLPDDYVKYKISGLNPQSSGFKESDVLCSGKFNVISGSDSNVWNFSAELELEYDKDYWIVFENEKYMSSYLNVKYFQLPKTPMPNPPPTPQPEIKSRLILPSGNMTAGGEYTLPIYFENVDDIMGLTMGISWNPLLIELDDISLSESVLNGSMSAYNINSESGWAKIALFVPKSVAIPSSVPVINFKYKVKGDEGSKFLLLGYDCEYSGSDFINYKLDCVGGDLGVVKLKGDFNGNKIIDIGDVSKVAYMVVGKETSDPNADFNFNGRTDIGDASKIAYYFVNGVGTL